ncbi:uncharacterized protein KY384_000027 [Bacidia gigantensis]|uniref:uncharacterized protein n=1 Tax=Bacidia gigantensis TaxID=2732470 RepID=UPI001D0467B9|nr:uncharacterized protein KY384_000027 [Bacidia gigantensis]KAG8526434.1 hypothetical protein KY384_000027 [Bacidia gigantensis]
MRRRSDGSDSLLLPTPPLSAPLSESFGSSTGIEAWLNNIYTSQHSRTLKRKHQQFCPSQSQGSPKRVRRSARIAKAGQKGFAMPPRINELKVCHSRTNALHSPSCMLTVWQDAASIPVTPPQSSLHDGSLRSRAPTLPTSHSTGITTDPTEIRQRLQNHHMYQSPGRLEKLHNDSYKMIKEKITRVLDIEMGQQSIERFTRIYNKYHGLDEDSYLAAILPLLAPQQRKVLDVPGEQEVWGDAGAGPLHPGRKYKLKDWDEDGVIMAVNKQYKDGFVPYCGDEALAKEMKKEDGITNPKPDRVFGLEEALFELPKGYRLYDDMAWLLTMIAGVFHAFFLIEGKSNKGLMDIAKNQACRAAATLIFQLRLFLDAIEVPDIEKGLDKRTYIFSMTLDANFAIIWIHYADKQDDGTIHYYMERIAHGMIESEEDVIKIQRCINNIQSWGSVERKNEILQYHKNYLHPHLKAVQAGRVAKKKFEHETLAAEKASVAEQRAAEKQAKAAEKKTLAEAKKAETRKKPQPPAPSTRKGLRSQAKRKNRNDTIAVMTTRPVCKT